MSDKLYLCPGEAHAITRAVHLARLAAFYPRCRECPLRHETGQLPRYTLERIHSTERRVERKSLLAGEGLRGVYLNEITRGKAGEAAAALADLLWEHKPLVGRAGGPDGAPSGRPALPLVVVGHDERPCAPDLMTGVVRSLRRMSCRVVDIGLATRSSFWFAVDHLKSSAGLFVTGSGAEPSWTGFDFLGPGGVPVSRGGGAAGFRLEALEARMGGRARRPMRQAGSYQMFQAAVPYEASLWKHFHALRPLTVCCGAASRLVRRTLDKVFATLPCRLVPVEIPARARDVLADADADVARVAAAVRRTRAHLGVLIDDDGQRTGFFDECGRVVSAVTITRLVARLLLAESPGGSVALERGAPPVLSAEIERHGGRVIDGGATFAEMSQALRDGAAVFGSGATGRLWFRENFPTCDAILSVARVLDVLSRSDAAFSAVAAEP